MADDGKYIKIYYRRSTFLMFKTQTMNPWLKISRPRQFRSRLNSNSSKIQTLIFHHSCRNQFPTLNTSKNTTNVSKLCTKRWVKRKQYWKTNSFKSFFCCNIKSDRRVISLEGRNFYVAKTKKWTKLFQSMIESLTAKMVHCEKLLLVIFTSKSSMSFSSIDEEK